MQMQTIGAVTPSSLNKAGSLDALAALPGSVHSRTASTAPVPFPIAPRSRLNGLDVFFAANALLFLLMCVAAYYDRWVQYVGRSHVAVAEFLFYAVLLLAGIGGLWVWLRRYAWPVWLLAVIEVGILAHFAGGLVHFGGARLYDHLYAAIRYDKYVHCLNAFLAAVTVQEIARMKRLPLTGLTRWLVFFTALGLGTGVEICEYVVTRTIPHNGVGGYDDNMRDMIANLVGGSLYLLTGPLRRQQSHSS
jgi:hypothetical protein